MIGSSLGVTYNSMRLRRNLQGLLDTDPSCAAVVGGKD